MKVLLISPWVGPCPVQWTPLGLPFVAAQLRRAGHTAFLFDRYTAGYRLGGSRDRVDEAMLKSVREQRPDLVGLSTVSPLISDTVRCAKLLRTVHDGPVVAGGYHATALPGLTLQKIPDLNGVVTGEGEIALTRLADGEPPADVPGVWWRDGEETRPPSRPAEQIADLDTLPPPALDLLDMDWYCQRTDGVVRRHDLRATTLVTSRGCWRRCRFCAESQTYGRGVRFHGPAYVLDWIRRVVSDYGVDGLQFHDNDFLADVERARAICEGLMKAGLHRRLKWSIQARADALTGELARLLRAAGCVLVEIGIEAGTREELDRMGKGTTPRVNLEAVSLCRRAGLDVHAYMLMGLEGETVADLEARLAWLRRARPTSFQWSGLAVHPGTPLYEEKGRDFFATHDWTDDAVAAWYGTDTLSAITPEERRAWMDRRFAPYARLNWLRDAARRLPLRYLYRYLWLRLKRRLGRPPARGGLARAGVGGAPRAVPPRADSNSPRRT